MPNNRKPIDIDDASAMYQSGATLAEVSDRYAVAPRTLMLRLREHGVEIRKRGSGPKAGQHSRLLTDDQELEVATRYRSGEHSEELARTFGVGRHTILNALKRQGCPRRDKREAQAQLNALRRLKGERHPNFKGGRLITADGYALVGIDETDPMWVMAAERRRKDYAGYIGTGYVLEHRLVMARHLGRPLERHETVHHKNGDRADNQIENLAVFVGRHTKGASEAHCPTCTCFVRD